MHHASTAALLGALEHLVKAGLGLGGREPDTALTGAVLTALEFESLDELIPWAADATPASLAALVPVVMQVATVVLVR